MPSTLETVRTCLRDTLQHSAVVKFLREFPATTADAAARSRSLTPAEITGLEAHGNFCENWDAVRILELKGSAGASLSPDALKNIRNCRFEGDVILRAAFDSAAPGGSILPILWNSRFRHVVIGGATVENTALAQRVWIDDGASLNNVGEVSGRKNSRFGLGRFLQPGSETGTRKVFMLGGLRISDCAAMAALTPGEQEIIDTELRAALRGLETDYAYIGAKVRIEHAVLIENSFIGPGATLRGAVTVLDSILASAFDAPIHVGESSLVSESLLDAGVGVHSAAQVHRSLLLEYSGAERAAQVSDSVLGPNTRIAKGEITASLVGPFTGFHHQSLLIGALWPEGRGNVGYGANVGSNHTGRQPDQELRAGEGVFFGLGCSIKFPANFEAAPYSLFASGVIAAPQKITFPFSLITTPAGSTESGAGLNEILPGWMWSENAYALVRNAYKYADRNCAQRHPVPEITPPEESPLAGTFLASDLFAPRIAGFVQYALTALSTAGATADKSYTANHVAGLGANFLSLSRLEKARAAYENYLAFVRVRTLLWSGKKDIENAGSKENVAGLFEAFAASVEASLAKDITRGRTVFDDYEVFHSDPETDPVCRRLRTDLSQLQAAWVTLTKA